MFFSDIWWLNIRRIQDETHRGVLWFEHQLDSSKLNKGQTTFGRVRQATAQLLVKKQITKNVEEQELTP